VKTWWEILGVDRDADLRTIKSAYAGQLKTIRQDEDPKGFMALRAAYDAARTAVAQREIGSEEQFDPQDWNTIKITDLHSLDGEPQNSIETWDAEQSPQPHIPGPAELLMDEVDKLMKSPWGAGSIASWQNILDDERLDDIDVYGDFEHALLNYFLNIHGFFNDDENISPKINLDVAGGKNAILSILIQPSMTGWPPNFCNQNVAPSTAKPARTKGWQSGYLKRRRRPMQAGGFGIIWTLLSWVSLPPLLLLLSHWCLSSRAL